MANKHFTAHQRPRSPVAFFKADNQWKQIALPAPSPNIPTESLVVITYNVWFDTFQQPQRAQELFRLVAHYNPHVVCLQEVTKNFVEWILQQSTFRDHGWMLSEVTFGVERWYGVAILSRIMPASVIEHALPTFMDRSLYIAEFNINNEKVAVATVHLESLDNRELRQAQLQLVEQYLRPYNHAMLMGDFNFDAEKNFDPADPRPVENSFLAGLLPQYIDCWAHLRPKEKGLTFDTKENAMIANHTTERMRYDRIMLRSQPATPGLLGRIVGQTPGKQWHCSSIDMLGTKPFSDQRGIPVVVSDHFGLIASFTFK